MEQPNSSLVILCEGDADIAFFRKQLSVRAIAGVDVTCGKGAIVVVWGSPDSRHISKP